MKINKTQTDILVSAAVRVTGKKTEEGKIKDKLGSGIIVWTGNKHVLFTCGHCIEEANEKTLEAEVMMTGNFEKLEIVRIINFSKYNNDDDFAICELNLIGRENALPKIYLKGDNHPESGDIELYSYGFPMKDRERGHKLNLEYAGPSQYKVMEGYTPEVDEFSEWVKGFSGAGIIDVNKNDLICVGLIREMPSVGCVYSKILAIEYNTFIDRYNKQGITQKEKGEKIENDGYYKRYCCSANEGMYGYMGFGVKRKTLREYLEAEEDENCRRIVLCGGAQTGKSMELKNLNNLLVKENKAVRFINLKERKEIRKEDLLNEPEGYVLIDGLDELDPNGLQSISNKIAEVYNDNPGQKMVITCRENFIGYVENKGFSILELEGLSNQDIFDILKAKTGEEGKAKKFFNELRDKDLLNLCRSPFNLQCIIKTVVDEGDDMRILEDQIDIYSRIVESYRKQEKEKKEKGLPDFHRLDSPLKKIGWEMVEKDRYDLTRDEVEKLLGNKEDMEYFTLSGVIEFTNDRYHFITNGFREYFAALNIVDYDDLKNVKELLCYHDTDRIRNKFMNVAKLWINQSTRNKEKTGHIINWIKENNLLLVLDIRKESLSESSRVGLVKEIIDTYKEKNLPIYPFLNENYRKINDFAFSRDYQELLNDELRNVKKPDAHLYNLVMLVAYLDWEKVNKDNPELFGKLRDALRSITLEFYNYPNIEYIFLWIFNNPVFIEDRAFVEAIIEKVKDSKEYSTMSAVCWLIYRIYAADKFVDYLKEADKIIVNQRDEEGVVTVVNRTSLLNAIGSLTQPGNIIDFLDLVLSHDFRYREYTGTEEYNELWTRLLKGLYESDKEVFMGYVESKFEDDKMYELLYSGSFFEEAFKIAEKDDSLKDLREALLEKLNLKRRPKPEDLKEKKQDEFNFMWNYEEFRKEFLAVLEGEKDAIGCPIRLYENHYISEFYSLFSNYRHLDIDKLKEAIEDEKKYRLFRMYEIVKLMENNYYSINYEDKIDEIKETAGEILDNYKEYRTGLMQLFLNEALRLFVNGIVVPSTEEKLLDLAEVGGKAVQPFKKEKESGWTLDKFVLERIVELAGEEKVVRRIEGMLDEIVRYPKIDSRKLLELVVEKGNKESRYKIYSQIVSDSDSPIAFWFFDDFLTKEDYQAAFYEDFDKFSMPDKLKIWKYFEEKGIKGREDLKVKLKGLMGEMQNFSRRDFLNKLSELGDKEALEELSRKKEDLIDQYSVYNFNYHQEENLPLLLDILGYMRSKKERHRMFIYGNTYGSLLSSIGNIAERSDECLEKAKKVIEDEEIIRYLEKRRIEWKDMEWRKN